MTNTLTVKIKDVPRACEELAESVSELDEVLKQFQGALVTVTRCEPACDITERQEDKSVCEISNKIRYQIHRLKVISEQIRIHSSMIEI